ncbi:hypothetical protein IT414_00250 [bacterium]|nr:hypothetical protein [bacterium]
MLKSPTVKLLLGILFIALIVVATFAYGRSQREAAIKSSPSVTVEASESASPQSVGEEGNGDSEATTPTPSATSTPAATATPAPSATAAPNNSPEVATATTPETGNKGETPTTTPETGSGLEYALPIAVLMALFAAYRKSVNQKA